MTADRKQTPDILGSLLGDTMSEAPKKTDTIKPEYHNTGIPEYHKDSKPVKQPTSKTVSRSTSKTVSHKKPSAPPVQEASGEKVKATYYIDSQAVEELEAGWIQLRKMADKKVRGQVSKSLIVEMALQIVLEDLEKTGQKSQIARKIL